MPSSWIYSKYPKEANRITLFLLIMVLVGLIIGKVFKQDKVEKQKTEIPAK